MQCTQWRDSASCTNITMGVAAGALGGLVGAWSMTQFQTLWSKASAAMADGSESEQGTHKKPQQTSEGTHGAQAARNDAREDQAEPEEPATVKAAERIRQAIGGRELSDSQKQMAGNVMHYGFGASMGALYGGLAEVMPWITRGAGLPAGAVLWAVADEGVVPMLRLAKPPMQHPASVHISALVSHLIFGLSVEMVRRAKPCVQTSIAQARAKPVPARHGQRSLVTA